MATYTFVQSENGVALAESWIDPATNSPSDGRPLLGTLRQIDFQPFRHGEPTSVAYEALHERNSHVIGPYRL